MDFLVENEFDVNMLFSSVPEFHHQRNEELPGQKLDISKPIYEVCSPILNTFDMCQTLEEARHHIRESGWKEWSLWEIQGGFRRMIDFGSDRMKQNALKLAFLNAKEKTQ